MRLLKLVYILFGIEFMLAGISLWVGENYGLVYYIYPKEYLEFYSMDFNDLPYWVPFLLGCLYISVPLYNCFILWIEDGCNIIKWFKSPEKKQIYKYINIDLIRNDDFKWRNEIRHRAKKEKLIAYSKKGYQEAKYKAKVLRLEECFVDFKSREEVEKDRGW